MTPITTERLEIRNFRPDDWAELQEIIVQFQDSQYSDYDHEWPTSDEKLREIAEWFAGGDRFMAVVLKDSGKLIGFISLNPKGEEPHVEFGFGYYFNFNYHGKGYATEGCQAVLKHAFDSVHVERITTGTAKENEPSCKLLEGIGMRKTGEKTASFRKTKDGKPIEFLAHSYSLTREQWFRREEASADPNR